MPAYVVAELTITDPTKFEEYRIKAGPTIAKHDGRFIANPKSRKMPEGGHWKPELVVVIEFPDMNALTGWYNSAEYQPLIALRKESTSDQSMLFFVDGA